MSFTDFSKVETLKSLNEFLADKSYVDGYVSIYIHIYRYIQIYLYTYIYMSISSFLMIKIFGPCLWGGLRPHRMSDTEDSNLFPDERFSSFLNPYTNISANATQADVAVYKAFQKQFPQFARWFNHIASFTEEFDTLPAGKAPAAAAGGDDDDEVDLFGSDEDDVDEEAEKVKAERVAQYAAKKAAKGPKPAAKSIVTLEVKPWDDETDLEQMLANLKKIEKEGLKWGAHQWIPVGFGIKKLQMNVVVEDDKVSLDELQAEIEEDEDHVQSTDIAAMQKL